MYYQGKIVVMGDLMQEKSHNNCSGLPGFMDTPVDYLSSERDRETNVTELVIFLRSTVIRKKTKNIKMLIRKIIKCFHQLHVNLSLKNEIYGINIREKEKGFSLIEVAITIVIVGLVTSLTLKGKEPIHKTKLNSFVDQANSFRMATQMLMEKYSTMPGDFTVP